MTVCVNNTVNKDHKILNSPTLFEVKTLSSIFPSPGTEKPIHPLVFLNIPLVGRGLSFTQNAIGSSLRCRKSPTFYIVAWEQVSAKIDKQDGAQVGVVRRKCLE